MAKWYKKSLLVVVALILFLSAALSPAMNAPTAHAQMPASSQVLDIVSIPADGTAVTSHITLAANTLYSIRLSGTWVWGGCDSSVCPNGGPDYLRWGDAAYLSDDYFHSFADPWWSGYIFLQINGQRPNFGPYNASHVYSTQITGTGGPATFRIHDEQDPSYQWYLDNAGSLRAEIIAGPDNGAVALGALNFKQYSIPYTLSQWGNKSYGDPKRPNVLASDTISNWGCFLTCWAMILDYYGHLPGYNVHTNPDVLNDWLRLPENRGYCGNNNDGTYNGKFVDSNKVIEYGQTVMGLPLFPVVNYKGDDPAKLNSLLEEGIPVILGVRDKNDGYGPQHYVLAVGETTSLTGQPTWYINDPAYPLNTTLDEQYGNLFTTMTYTDSPAGPHSFFGAIMLMLKSPAELLVTDPQGRRTGVDPRTNTIYNEIPEASYVTLGLAPEDDGEPIHPLKVFDSPTPIDGHYSIQVIGTGNGSYTLDSLSYDDLGNSNSTSVSRSVAVDSVDTYEMDYSSGESTSVTGTTREVNGDILPGVTITLDGAGPVLSDQSGSYEIMGNSTGSHTLVAHKDGFRDRTQTINIAGLGSGYAVTCNFQGTHGLIPNAPDIWYALDCVNRWLYPPNPDIGLDIWTALDVINDWLYPVQ